MGCSNTVCIYWRRILAIAIDIDIDIAIALSFLSTHHTTHRALHKGACFAFGFFATQWIAPNLGMRVLAGVVCMIFAVGAELYFLIKTSIKDD